MTKTNPLIVNLSIAIASDHAGFQLKSFIIPKLRAAGYIVDDIGCSSSEKSVDYPDFAKKLITKITAKKAQFGILICGSGVGVSIAANRSKKIRAALCASKETAKLSRLHNDANVICLGARLTKPTTALALVKIFLTTKFEGGRHEKRVAKLSK